jgi:hypothetical protein
MLDDVPEKYNNKYDVRVIIQYTIQQFKTFGIRYKFDKDMC